MAQGHGTKEAPAGVVTPGVVGVVIPGVAGVVTPAVAGVVTLAVVGVVTLPGGDKEVVALEVDISRTLEEDLCGEEEEEGGVEVPLIVEVVEAVSIVI